MLSEWEEDDLWSSVPPGWARKVRMIRKVRFWRYDRKSSFLVERREKEEGGGWMADGDGSEDNEEVREPVKDDSKVGSEGVSVISYVLKQLNFSTDLRYFSMPLSGRKVFTISHP